MDNLQAINHIYNFNNAVPMLDYVMDVCKYLDMKYRELEKLVAEDERKNEDLKYDFREYTHEKAFSAGLDFYFYSKVQRNLPSVHSYADLESMRQSGLLKQLSSFSVKLNYDYGVGKYGQTEKHNNEIELKFRPYEITLTRVSNYADAAVDEIEATVKRKMDEFVSYETIFGD